MWPETAVEENNLNHNVSVLRKALGEKATGQQYIETVPRVGYRFAAPVEVDGRPAHAGAHAFGAAKARQEIRYCTTSDGVRLAYATQRQRTAAREGVELADASRLRMGQPDLAPLVDNALSHHHRLVRYDERGNGMSQRDVADVSFDTWVRDLETVVDAAGLDRFPLLGISRGGGDRHRVRGEASRARHAAGALRRIRGGHEARRHDAAARGAARPRAV